MEELEEMQPAEHTQMQTPVVTNGRGIRKTAILAAGYLSVFTAFCGIQDLQTSLNNEKGLGLISLSSLYGTFIVSGIFAPAVMGLLGVKTSVVISFVCHLLYAFSNLYPTFATLIPSSVLVGAASGVVWTSQSTYIAICACAHSEISGKKYYEVLNRLSGLFYAIMGMAGVAGNLISSLILQQGTHSFTNLNVSGLCGSSVCPSRENGTDVAGPDITTIYILMGIFIFCEVIGLAVVIILVSPLPTKPTRDISPVKRGQKLLCFCWTAFIQRELILLSPLILSSTMTHAVLIGDYTRAFVTCTFGIQMVGFIMASFGVSKSIFSFVFSRVGKCTGRYVLITFSSSLNMSLLVLLFHWVPSPGGAALMFAIPVILGIAQGIWSVQIISMLAILFPKMKEGAFATHHTLKAAGYTISFLLSRFMCVSDKLLICMGILGLGFVLYAVVEIRIKLRKHRSAHSLNEEPLNTQ